MATANRASRLSKKLTLRTLIFATRSVTPPFFPTDVSTIVRARRAKDLVFVPHFEGFRSNRHEAPFGGRFLMTNRRLVNRRLLLRGLGGAAVAAPFLSSLWERRVGAQAATPPKRLIFMFTHYGCITTKFFPAVSNGPLASATDLSPTLQPLAPYVKKLLIPRGIRSMNEWTQNMVRGQGNDPHTQVVGSYFTCQPVTPNSDDPFSFDSSTKFKAMPIGPSLDHVITQCLSADGKGTPMLMRVGNQNDTAQSGISYASAGTLFPGLGSP